MKQLYKKLPELGKDKKRLINKKKLHEISEKLRDILKKEGKTPYIDENFSSGRNNFTC